jgi:hypothetical protein
VLCPQPTIPILEIILGRVEAAPAPLGLKRLLPLVKIKVQSDGDLHFIEALPTLDSAKARVRLLGALWAGDYVIDNEQTG